MKIIINEEQLKIVIKEELGILQDIHDEAIRIYNSIISDLPNREKIKHENNNIVYQKGRVKANVIGHEFNLNYCYRNFINKETIDEIGEENLVTGNSAYLGKYNVLCTVNFYGINGSIVKSKALEIIQHELEHILQEFRAQKTIPNNMFYAKMRTDMESPNENRKKIGRLIYGCLKSEQEGFVNGLYSYCMVDDFQTPPYSYDNIGKSETGKLYNEIIGYFNELKNNIEMQVILKEYRWSIKKIEKHINNFIKRIGRVLIKVNKDKFEKGWR